MTWKKSPAENAGFDPGPDAREADDLPLGHRGGMVRGRGRRRGREMRKEGKRKEKVGG